MRILTVVKILDDFSSGNYSFSPPGTPGYHTCWIPHASTDNFIECTSGAPPALGVDVVNCCSKHRQCGFADKSHGHRLLLFKVDTFVDFDNARTSLKASQQFHRCGQIYAVLMGQVPHARSLNFILPTRMDAPEQLVQLTILINCSYLPCSLCSKCVGYFQHFDEMLLTDWYMHHTIFFLIVSEKYIVLFGICILCCDTTLDKIFLIIFMIF